MQKRTKTSIEQALHYARSKHPKFASSLAQGLLLAQEELGEAIQAFNNGEYEKVDKELAHTAAVIVRMLNNEFVV